MRTEAERQTTTQVYQVFIGATPEVVWEAITKPEWTERYGYGASAEYDLRPGGAYRGLASEEMRERGGPEVVVDGEVVEAVPPRRLVQTWRALWSPDLVEEGFTRLTWEIEPGEGGVTKLTLSHDVAGAPRTAAFISGAVPQTGGGWSWILSDLKTLLETGLALGR